MTAAALHQALVDAGLKVHQHPGWETRGGRWADGQPVGVMHHHTAAPVPYPVDRLAGALIKCNMNIKPDGTVWLVAYGACNYSSGSGSSKVLAEVKAGTPPTRNASDRGLPDDTNGNPHFWNSENDHYGTGGPLPEPQEKAIVVATRVVNDHFELSGRNMIGHACWTRRKQDPYWNGNRRAIDDIRDLLEEDMVDRNSAVEPNPSLADNVQKMVDAGVFSQHTQPGGVTFNDELATFLERAGVLDIKQALASGRLSEGKTWTKKQITALIAGSAAGGATAAEVIQEIIRRLGG